MKTIEEKAKAYDSIIEKANKMHSENCEACQACIEELIPELKESEDEKIRKALIEMVHDTTGDSLWIDYNVHKEDALAWLEKQGEQKPSMMQWKGDNLKEVIGFTGKDKNFDKWFTSFEEYERYIREHNNTFKLFNEDGSHIEVPVGAWIVKTPDGYNTASRYVFRQKPAVWSEEDETVLNNLIYALANDRIGNNRDEYVEYLKSLKDRYTWKPSDEQMKALNYYIKYNVDSDGVFGSQLVKLYQDLLKLREK